MHETSIPCLKKQKNGENFKTIVTPINEITLSRHKQIIPKQSTTMS